MKIGCWEVRQNQLTPPYFDQLSERYQLLSEQTERSRGVGYV